MSKKIIVALMCVVILITSVFVACNKTGGTDKGSGSGNTEKATTEKIYIDDDEYLFVTDEDGERVLNDVGQFVVYSTNHSGKIVKDKYGEPYTHSRPFEPFSNKDYIEEYGYKFKMPNGWEITSKNGYFQNPKTNETLSIFIEDESYEEVYSRYYKKFEDSKSYEEFSQFNTTWSENIPVSDSSIQGLVRYTIYDTQSQVNLIYYIFRSNGNVFRVFYDANKVSSAVENSELLINAITCKPYKYFEQTTENSTEAQTEAAS